MAINDDEGFVKPGDERRKVPQVDHPVLQFDKTSPNGRTYRSETFTTPLPEKPRMFSDARNRRGGYETMISVNVEPTHMPLPDVSVQAPYEEVVQYFNRTGRSIKVTNKHNVTFTLHKGKFWTPNNSEYFVVRKIIRINNPEVAASLLFNDQVDSKSFSIEDGEREKILEEINQAHRNGALRSPNWSTEIRIDRIIPIDLFYNFLAIYVSDLDLMFRLENTEISTPHPTSQDAIIRGEILDLVQNRRLTGAFYEIVDNDSQYTSRYVCLGKNVMQIPMHRDGSRENGIYYTEIDNVNIDRLQLSMRHLKLEDAENIGIFKTKEEAETKGHVEAAYKLELARMQREATEREAEISLLKDERQEARDQRQEVFEQLQHERKMNELRLGIDKNVMDHAKDRLGTEAASAEIVLKKQAREHQDNIEKKALERKDEFEGRSYDRKDTSEILKWVPALVTTGIAIGTGVMIAYNKGRDEGSRKLSAEEIGFNFDG